nr:hypothetical protein [Tanacetum cinerariifolium]
MSTSTHPIIVPSDFNVEDAFSFTDTPNYTPASPDYFPALPRNTSPNPSKDLSNYLLASLAISPFHDDPSMKVMQAYNATSNEPPILPQALIAPLTILPPSPMLPLLPIFDPRDFFLPKDIFPPQKRVRFLSPSSTDSSAPPKVFETGESSHKTHLKQTELQEARTQISGFQKEPIRHDDEIVLARVGTSTLEILIEDIQVRYRSDMKSLLDKINKLKNHKGRPPDY